MLHSSLSRMLIGGLMSALFTGAVLAAEGQGSDWSIMLGAGGGIGPKYEGSKKYVVGGIPLIDVSWKNRIFLGMRGLGVNAIATDTFKAGVAVAFQPGRDEKDGARLKGLGDIKDAAAIRGFADYTLSPIHFSADVVRALGGSDGLTATIGTKLEVPVSDRVSLSGGVSATWADGNYMKSYFGVSSVQSARSGLARFKAESGVKNIDISAGAQYRVTDHWAAIANASVSFLIGDAAKSAVSERDTALSGILGVAYKF